MLPIAAGCSNTPSILELKAFSGGDSTRLPGMLAGAIRACGGWVLHCGPAEDSALKILFEFECAASLEIYSMLIAAGLELSRNGHIGLTRLWQCSRHRKCALRTPIARVAIAIYASPAKGHSPAPADVSISEEECA